MERIDNNGKWMVIDGIEILVEPSESWIESNQPQKTADQLLEYKQNQYRQKVAELVSQRYSIAAELAIVRKKMAGIDTKDEFTAYNDFVETVKATVKSDVGL